MSDQSIKKLFEHLVSLRDGVKRPAGDDEAIRDLIEYLIDNRDDSSVYLRTMSVEERQYITLEAFGYLVNLHYLGSVDRYTFEKIMNLCLTLSGIINRRVSRGMVEQIVNLILFSGMEEISMRDIVEMFIREDAETDLSTIQ